MTHDNINTEICMKYNEENKESLIILGTKENGEIRKYDIFNLDDSFPLKRMELYDTITVLTVVIIGFIKGELNRYKAEIGNINDITEVRFYNKIGGSDNCGIFINNKLVYEAPYEISNFNEMLKESNKINKILLENVRSKLP